MLIKLGRADNRFGDYKGVPQYTLCKHFTYTQFTRPITNISKVRARLFELVHLVRGRADVEEDDLRIAVDEPPAAVDPVPSLPKLFHGLT